MTRTKVSATTAALAALGLAFTGCARLDADTGAWAAAESITGELAPELGPAPPPRAAPPAGSPLRIASWNLHYAADPLALAAAIAASPELATADVIFAQELDAFPGEAGTRASRLGAALGMTWVYAPARLEDPDGTHGIAIFSRYPLEQPRVRSLPHFEQPLHERERIALAAEVVIGAARLTVVNVHLDVRLGPVDRIAQLAPAVESLAADAPVVMGGDFNSNPWAWVDGTVPLLGTEAVVGQDQAAVLDDYLGALGFAVAIPPSVGTARVPVYTIRLDGLYTRASPILGSGSPHADGSDHWPIYVDVPVPAAPPTI